MAELAKHVAVEIRNGKASIKIDGDEFPWFIAENGIQLIAEPNSLPTVTVTVLAEHVTIDESIGWPT